MKEGKSIYQINSDSINFQPKRYFLAFRSIMFLRLCILLFLLVCLARCATLQKKSENPPLLEALNAKYFGHIRGKRMVRKVSIVNCRNFNEFIQLCSLLAPGDVNKMSEYSNASLRKSGIYHAFSKEWQQITIASSSSGQVS